MAQLVDHLPGLHERDCAPCAAAIAVIDELAAVWDPNDTWSDVPAPDTPDEQSLLEQAYRIAAGVLHDYPIKKGAH
jgi:hypothetical protein